MEPLLKYRLRNLDNQNFIDCLREVCFEMSDSSYLVALLKELLDRLNDNRMSLKEACSIIDQRKPPGPIDD
jgi:hypothetical protein